MKKKIIAILLSAWLWSGFFGMDSQVVYARDGEAEGVAASAALTQSPDQAKLPAQEGVYLTQKGFIEGLYQRLMNREPEFQMIYRGDLADLYRNDPKELFEAVWEIDRTTSSDFDYLRYSIKDYALQADTNQGQSVLRFHLSYNESAPQLRQVDEAVKKALSGLKLSNDPEAVKVRKVHDYVIWRAKYYIGQGKDSAYDAIQGKKASSCGYALLTYKMLTEARVHCRIVTGNVSGAHHIWNMVQVENKWYYLDNALDDPDDAAILVRYQYFLRGSEWLRKDHALSDAFQMAEFKSDYPVSESDYYNRNKLILQADVQRVKAKSGVGLFNEAYHEVSNRIVDPFEALNDGVTNGALDALAGVFWGI